MFLKGELQNLEAVVADVTEDGKILVQPKIEGFYDTVDCDPEELMKFFEVRWRYWMKCGSCFMCGIRRNDEVS